MDVQKGDDSNPKKYQTLEELLASMSLLSKRDPALKLPNETGKYEQKDEETFDLSTLSPATSEEDGPNYFADVTVESGSKLENRRRHRENSSSSMQTERQSRAPKTEPSPEKNSLAELLIHAVYLTPTEFTIARKATVKALFYSMTACPSYNTIRTILGRYRNTGRPSLNETLALTSFTIEDEISRQTWQTSRFLISPVNRPKYEKKATRICNFLRENSDLIWNIVTGQMATEDLMCFVTMPGIYVRRLPSYNEDDSGKVFESDGEDNMAVDKVSLAKGGWHSDSSNCADSQVSYSDNRSEDDWK